MARIVYITICCVLQIRKEAVLVWFSHTKTFCCFPPSLCPIINGGVYTYILKQELLDALANQSEESRSTGGLLIEIDGSISEEYIRGRKFVAYMPKGPALLSLGGSMYIIYSIIGGRGRRNREQKLKQGYQRLLLMLSLADVFSSVALFLTTWAIPTTTRGGYFQYAWDIQFPGAAGNEATCNLQV